MLLATAPRSATAQAAYGSGTAANAYSFLPGARITRCKFDGTTNSTEAEEAPWNAAYYVIGDAAAADTALIAFFDWATSTDATSDYALYNVDLGSKKAKYWCVPKADLIGKSRKYALSSWSPTVGAGLIVVPVKLRTGFGRQESAFTTDVSLGGSLDLSWRISHYSETRFHIPVFAGVGSAQIDADQSNLTEERSVPTFSFGLGIGFSSSNAGAGFLIGWDIINKNAEIDWDHQARAWFGISIGASFGVTTPKETGTN